MTNTEKTGVLAMTVIVIIILALVMTAGERQDGPLTPGGANNKVKIALEKKELPWRAEPLEGPDLSVRNDGGASDPAARGGIDERKLDDVFDGEWVDPNRRARSEGPKRRVAPEPRSEPKPPVTYREYTVRDGDVYGTIAQQQLGTMRRWPEIQALNPDVPPHKLRAGMVIKIPIRQKRLKP